MGIKKFIGLEGLNGSGKTTVLKKMSETLVEMGGVVRHIFSMKGLALNGASFPPSIGDYIVVIEINGKIVVIATGGDDWWVPEVTLKAIADIQIRVDVFIAAIRKSVHVKRKHPGVREGYVGLLGECQKQFVSKDRYGGCHPRSSGGFSRADNKCVKVLMRELV